MLLTPSMAHEALVLRRVRAIDPAVGLDAEVDVVIERGRITRVGTDAAESLLRETKVRVVDRAGASPAKSTRRTSRAASRQPLPVASSRCAPCPTRAP
jgi:predicted amidohydrolase